MASCSVCYAFSSGMITWPALYVVIGCKVPGSGSYEILQKPKLTHLAELQPSGFHSGGGPESELGHPDPDID